MFVYNISFKRGNLDETYNKLYVQNRKFIFADRVKY